jgi:hypothetical protein
MCVHEKMVLYSKYIGKQENKEIPKRNKLRKLKERQASLGKFDDVKNWLHVEEEWVHPVGYEALQEHAPSRWKQ